MEYQLTLDNRLVLKGQIPQGSDPETLIRIVSQELESRYNSQMARTDYVESTERNNSYNPRDYWSIKINGRHIITSEYACPNSNVSLYVYIGYCQIKTILEYFPLKNAIKQEILEGLNEPILRYREEDESDIIYYINYILDWLVDYYEGGRSFVDDKKKSANIQERANRPDRRSKLVAPMGLELTYHPPLKKSIASEEYTRSDRTRRIRHLLPENSIFEEDTEENRVSMVRSTRNVRVSRSAYDYTKSLRQIFFKEKMLENFGAKIYSDVGEVVEVCTPVHRSWKDMRQWFVLSYSIAKKNRFTTWSRIKGGGGMHINISYNKTIKNWKLAYINFFIMIANHPEINWIFNEPSDNHTANALVRNPKFIEFIDSIREIEGPIDWDKIWDKDFDISNKGYAINMKDEYHFELRTFEMVRSVDELKDVIDFVNALLSFCMEVASRNVLIPLEVEVPDPYMDEAFERGYLRNDENTIFVFSGLMHSAVYVFNRLLRDLGLDPKRYNKYIKRNFYRRREEPYGKKYMV